MKISPDLILGGLIGLGVLFLASHNKTREKFTDVDKNIENIKNDLYFEDISNDGEIDAQVADIPSHLSVRIASSPYWRV